MTRKAVLDFDRHCAQIVTQTSLLVGHLDGADVALPVPSCPGWNVSQLVRHVDGGQRWAREIGATRASGPPSDRSRDWTWGVTPSSSTSGWNVSVSADQGILG